MATRMSNDTAMQVMLWHTAHGGHVGRARGHALKLFEEVVELALAAGASKQDLFLTLTAQFKREDDKKLANPHATASNLHDEVADVAILLEVFVQHGNLDVDSAVQAKLPVLRSRQWIVTSDGVLLRPGRTLP